MLAEQQELTELLRMLPTGKDDAMTSILDPQNHRKERIQQACIIGRRTVSRGQWRLMCAWDAGTTCMATTLPVFDAQRFDVVLLDEACQVMEPMSLLPLVRFGSSRAVLIGDPLQMGVKVVWSAVCHPRIAAISNDLVYRRCLVNGVGAADRDPLLEQLSTLAFIDVPGEEHQASKSGSLYNDMEVAIIVQTVRHLLRCGIAPQDVGIVTLYKAQVERIEARLGLHDQATNRSTSSGGGSSLQHEQVSTVDAFQYIGFLANLRRINVAFTRAKRIWRQFIEEHCKAYPHGYYTLAQFQRELAQLAPSDTLPMSSPPADIPSPDAVEEEKEKTSLSVEEKEEEAEEEDSMAIEESDAAATTAETTNAAANGAVNPLFLSLLQQMNRHASSNMPADDVPR
ncbi:P-loop containing nucleoside triphosphate hydrolase protein [Syncephalis pseudoplumigaleata]|uniref:P-loop containing nucleoside triphosphate hydrolase protein n=1 Tax=Syncephalis pseudoplumigaleata TaxID=1712513 RepID=A0A4P9YZD9_9FUNG|nr:P-loop containing nucleoside triphosphate hydrolase protein [Syncephalis pseudoplumigaleata]|eukprot:RKP25543.1 P-loop containing nucleoside triphosphate hydrolase protein [Syncephalis pseudoplumigaleata]